MGLNKLRDKNPNDNLCQKMGRRKLRSEAVWVRGPPVRMSWAQSRFEMKWSGETAVKAGTGAAPLSGRGEQ